MSIFTKGDLLVTIHPNSVELVITELGGRERQRKFKLPFLGVGEEIVQVFPIGDPREGRIVVICKKSIFVLTTIELTETSDDKESRSSFDVTQVNTIEITTKPSFSKFNKGCDFHHIRRNEFLVTYNITGEGNVRNFLKFLRITYKLFRKEEHGSVIDNISRRKKNYYKYYINSEVDTAVDISYNNHVICENIESIPLNESVCALFAGVGDISYFHRTSKDRYNWNHQFDCKGYSKYRYIGRYRNTRILMGRITAPVEAGNTNNNVNPPLPLFVTFRLCNKSQKSVYEVGFSSTDTVSFYHILNATLIEETFHYLLIGVVGVVHQWGGFGAKLLKVHLNDNGYASSCTTLVMRNLNEELMHLQRTVRNFLAHSDRFPAFVKGTVGSGNRYALLNMRNNKVEIVRFLHHTDEIPPDGQQQQQQEFGFFFDRTRLYNYATWVRVIDLPVSTQISTVLIMKSQKSRDEDEERIDHLLQVLENRNIQKEGKETFWPYDLSVLFREFEFSGNETFRIPDFFFLFCGGVEEVFKNNNNKNFEHISISSIDEVFVIRFLTLGISVFETVSVEIDDDEDEEDEDEGEGEKIKSSTTDSKKKKNDENGLGSEKHVQRVKDLLLFLHFTELRIFELYLICNLQNLLSLHQLIQIFEDFVPIYGSGKKKNEEDDEDEDDEKTNSQKLVNFNIHFENGFMLGLFWEIFRRRKGIQGDVYVKYKLHQIGFFFEIECMEETMLQLEKHKDFVDVFRNEEHLVEKEQLRLFDNVQSFWMGNVMKFFLKQSNKNNLLNNNNNKNIEEEEEEEGIKLEDRIDNSRRKKNNEQHDDDDDFPTKSSVILSTIEDNKNDKSGIKLPKLFLMLFSNFFCKMFRYDMEMKENSQRHVLIQGFTTESFFHNLLRRTYLVDKFLLKKNNYNTTNNLHCLLEMLLHFEMYNEWIFSFETELELVYKMNELSRQNLLVLRLLEIGFRMFLLPEYYQKRIFRNVKIVESSSGNNNNNNGNNNNNKKKRNIETYFQQIVQCSETKRLIIEEAEEENRKLRNENLRMKKQLEQLINNNNNSPNNNRKRTIEEVNCNSIKGGGGDGNVDNETTQQVQSSDAKRVKRSNTNNDNF